MPDSDGTTAHRTPERLREASRLMMSFAERTGLSSDQPPRRYLWTDAFAVCNFLELGRLTGEPRYADLAFRLVDRVHHTLGRHRPDDPRRGWISGLGEQEGEAHPTRSGLRIGKKLPERGPSEPFDEALEWERDGQYFHYLTKWMLALDQVSRSTRQPHFNAWARELARTAHAAFVQRPPRGGRPRMAWKMSIDLSRPLVSSMGQHDPLDGLVTCAELATTARQLPQSAPEPTLTEEQASYRSMVEVGSLATADPLGIGGLLMDACRVAQLAGGGALAESGLLPGLLAGAADGLRHYAGQRDFTQPAWRRLAFRELGLAIGLHAIELVEEEVRRRPARVGDPSPLRARLDALHPYVSLGAWLETFWLDPAQRQGRTWSEHRDINEVMLATSLVPEGCLVLRSLD